MKAKDILCMNHEYYMQNALSGQLPTEQNNICKIRILLTSKIVYDSFDV